VPNPKSSTGFEAHEREAEDAKERLSRIIDKYALNAKP